MRLMLSVIRLALTTLRENKVRSFLTVLGVIIGTGTIIAVGSIIAGMDGAITGVIRSMGTNTAIVMKFRMGPGSNTRTAEERQRKPLTWENAVAIAERCPSVEHVSPYLFPPQVRGFISRARYKGNDYLGPQIFGTDENYATSGRPK
jgi:putative ABC transport system permease protein